MHGNRAQEFMLSIVSAELDEIDCSSFLEVVSHYVEPRLGDAAITDPGMLLHKRLCAECAELYEALSLVVALEESDRIPPASTLWNELAQLSAATPTADRQAQTSLGAGAGPKPALSYTRRTSPWAAVEELFHRRRRPLWAAAAGVCAALALAVGSWAMGRSHVEEELLPFVAVASTATEVRSVDLAGGGTLRVLYNPDSPEFVVRAQAANPTGGRLRCWLITDSGERHLAEYSARVDGEAVWVARAAQPLAMYVGLAVTSEPGGAQMAQIALR